jgi:hypothetical protein
MWIKFCLKLSKIIIEACDKLEMICRGEMNRTHSYAFQSSLVDATVHKEFVPQMFYDVYQKLSIILMFLC